MLASCQKIINITPIEGADKIETATVLGWQVVIAKKDNFKIGDLVCYIQIDTICPETEQFEFLRDRKFRVRTVKLRKQISQGLIIPLPKGKWNEGNDMTDAIGIKKYEKTIETPDMYDPIPRKPKTWYRKYVWLFKYKVLYKLFPGLHKKIKQDFPTGLITKTDETRIQNIPKVLESHKGKQFVISYKLDGSSITIIHEKKGSVSKFRVCSRNTEYLNTRNPYYQVFADNNFATHILKLVEYYDTNNIMVQGEAIGSFNGNHHGLSKDEIRLFNIYVNGKRISQNEFYAACLELEIPCCPFYSLNFVLDHTMDQILKMSEIPDKLNPKVPVEGLVWRCTEDNLSFKVINNKYLLDYEK